MVESTELRVGEQPGLGTAPEALSLREIDRFERVAEARPFLQLDFAEYEPPAAADDQVELDAAGADIPRQYPVAA